MVIAFLILGWIFSFFGGKELFLQLMPNYGQYYYLIWGFSGLLIGLIRRD